MDFKTIWITKQYGLQDNMNYKNNMDFKTIWFSKQYYRLQNNMV